ncbi:MAG TPA: pseudouridine synthase [Flavobacteriaceae bacterium]|nr:pseudouridine synthase [Flavobacteriaceae bacterium]
MLDIFMFQEIFLLIGKLEVLRYIAVMQEEKEQHFLLYKPDGYLSQFDINEPKGYKKKLLGEIYDFPEGTMAIGRLDEASEGLLLLTSNGKLSHFINSSTIEKEYYAQVDGVITEEALENLQNGLELTGDGNTYESKSCVAKKISLPDLPSRRKNIRGEHHGPTSWISVTLTEGKYRQVRRMTAAVGFPTLRLVRVRIGDLVIEGMLPEQVTPLPNLMELVDFE